MVMFFMLLVNFVLMLCWLTTQLCAHAPGSTRLCQFFSRHLVGDDALNHVGDSAVDDVNVVAKVMSGYLGISPAAGKS